MDSYLIIAFLNLHIVSVLYQATTVPINISPVTWFKFYASFVVLNKYKQKGVLIFYIVTENVEIVLDGKTYLLEKGDKIVIESWSPENLESNIKIDLIDPYLPEFLKFVVLNKYKQKGVLMFYIVTENVEIVLDGKTYLLEKGDKIVIESWSPENLESNIKIDLIDPYLPEFLKIKKLSTIIPKYVRDYVNWLTKKKPGLVENFDENKDTNANKAALRRVLLKLCK